MHAKELALSAGMLVIILSIDPSGLPYVSQPRRTGRSWGARDRQAVAAAGDAAVPRSPATCLPPSSKTQMMFSVDFYVEQYYTPFGLIYCIYFWHLHYDEYPASSIVFGVAWRTTYTLGFMARYV
ncbi:hypothetical protein NDU88_002726 [Pleurodeles waltl]|uniref:Uncharacterized protein n=1 Tax=Pleurodeles waltl TaxID=8319 RepID=A0AAV7QAP9_PLEWA|nr:hypothetical protein NDU88_002726 [Pleurodeles waltl]